MFPGEFRRWDRRLARAIFKNLRAKLIVIVSSLDRCRDAAFVESFEEERAKKEQKCRNLVLVGASSRAGDTRRRVFVPVDTRTLQMQHGRARLFSLWSPLIIRNPGAKPTLRARARFSFFRASRARRAPFERRILFVITCARGIFICERSNTRQTRVERRRTEIQNLPVISRRRIFVPLHSRKVVSLRGLYSRAEKNVCGRI